MKNLRNTKHLTIEAPALGNITACAWDASSESVLFTVGPTEHSNLLELRKCHTETQRIDGELPFTVVAAWDAPCPLPDMVCDRVLTVHHFSDTSSTCLVLAGGDIVVVRDNPLQGEDKIEIVGSVDAGIAAACWSPDEELLALCTKGETMLYMTRDFDSVASVEVLVDDLQASKHVSVGWGKAETQFRGKGAKALRDPTMPEKVEEGLLSANDDDSTTISWRGDGQYVALNSLVASGRRVVRVYTREAILDGVTEPTDFLEGALSWRPSGNLMAGIQRSAEDVNVVFFERNGLRHGSFSLRLSKEDLSSWASTIHLRWNVDSTVLAVIFKDRVQLWTMGNYHYYLKSEVLFRGDAAPSAASFAWHPERPLTFALASTLDTGAIKVLEYSWTVCTGALDQPHDAGAVAVIDGNTLKLTAIRYSNVPPPMAGHEISLDAQVIDCAMKSLGIQKIRIVSLTNHGVSLIDWSANEPSKPPEIIASYPILEQLPLSKSTFPSLRQISFSLVDAILILCTLGESDLLYNLNSRSGKLLHTYKDLSSSVKKMIRTNDDETGTVALGLSNGEILSQAGSEPTSWSINLSAFPHLPSNWEEFDVTGLLDNTMGTNGDASLLRDENLVVSLSQNGQLHANERMLATHCTSFLVTRTHIIFTTSKHLLKFVHVEKVDQLEVPGDVPEADERCRSIERGARLITVIPSKSALVLQMPRGNLETIYPRALVLAEIRRSIDRKHYKRAFLACRSHRVDMNILYDYDPKAFLQDVPTFVEQLDKTEYIDLFLSQLRNEDVSTTMYKETLKKPSLSSTLPNHPETKSPLDSSNLFKVNTICNSFIRTLRPLSGKRIQNLITAHVCKDPPDLVAGLKEVSKLQEGGPAEMELAIEHICFLIDVNKLFDAALGCYDLKLALLVAQNSQKDPREYLPFLNKLHAQPDLRMKFDVDNHLGRPLLCLRHLQAMDVFEEFKSYTEKHELYEAALELYKYQEDKTEALMWIYAAYLKAKSRHGEAGIAYEYVNDYKTACEQFTLAHLWREALAAAYAVPFETQQVNDLAQTLADGLVELKDYLAAATIMLEHLQDVASAAKLFCRGYFYADAVRILSLHGRRDLLVPIVDAGLGEGMSATIELLADFKGQLNAQVPRIQELRIKKEQEPMAFYDATANDGVDIPDNVSLAATDATTAGGTLFTRYTNRTGTIGTNATRKTSKNKRREERKRARGKKGSVYEEEYLVNSVERLIERVNTVQDEVSRLVTGLMQRRMRERAKAVQEAMVSVVGLCQSSVAEIFTVQSADQEKAKDSTEGRNDEREPDEVQWESMEELRKQRQAPSVKSFARLSLAGGES